MSTIHGCFLSLRQVTRVNLGPVDRIEFTPRSFLNSLLSSVAAVVGLLERLQHLVHGEAPGFLPRRILLERCQELPHELLCGDQEISVVQTPIPVRIGRNWGAL